ncbi:MAG: hemagglutinin repeat-containing protein, partial [Ferruginibacter sp.]|nr:hemagglutinin repeat-containing protein [Rhodoferax sp.]
TRPDPSGRYLVETDPRFTNLRQWLSSDYLLNALGYAPASVHKRLGDGFYEQQLIDQQVIQLTGQRRLGGFDNNQDQYSALMNAGATFARAYGLRPGIALTPAQMAQLTSDIVWLVEQSVTLADGTTQTVWAPQVYVRVRPGDLDGSGALLAGASVDLKLTGDLTNTGGTVAGRSLLAITAENVTTLGGRLQASNVVVNARHDLNVIGASVIADTRLIAQAGHDINLTSTTRSAASTTGASRFERATVDQVAGLYVTGVTGQGAATASSPGVLMVSAGHDLNLIAATLVNAAASGTTALSAGHDLKLDTVQTRQSDQLVFDAKNHLSLTTTTEVASQVQGAGAVRLQAGRDLVATAAELQAGGALALTAGRDLTLGAAHNTVTLDAASEHTTSEGFWSSTTRSTRDKIDERRSVGSSVGGASVAVQAGRDLTVSASNVASDSATRLIAGNNLTLQAGTSTNTATHFSQEQNSGLMSSGGIGFTYGERQKSNADDATTRTAASSTVGSVVGDVTLVAGNAYRQVGIDVLALAGDVTMVGRSVAITQARDTSHSTSEQRFSQSGLTVAVTAPVMQALQSVAAAAQATGATKSGRMQALGAASTALAAVAAVQAVQEAVATAATGALIDVSITVGSSKNKSVTTHQSDSARGSQMVGLNVTLAATGAGADSNLLVQGSDITAKHNATLLADHRIDLLASQASASQHTTSSSQSSAVGVALTVGAGGMGFGVTANASAARGHQGGTDVVHTNAHVNAGHTATLTSGGDITLSGAVVAASRVKAEMGGNLSIHSQQDTSVFDSKNQSLGGSVTAGLGGSASVNFSNARARGDFASVAEQSGLQAGDGGFDVKVRGATDLKGGVIASTQAAVERGLNNFQTATLTTSDLQNRSAANASSATVNVSSDLLGQGKYGVAKAVISNALNSGSASSSADSTTRSAVSGGSVAITDETAQLATTGKTASETVVALNRDTLSSNTTVQKQNVQTLQEQAQAEQAIKGLAVKQLTVYTDGAYRTMFQTNAKFYRVTCGGTQEQCMSNPSLLKMEQIDSATAKREGKVLAVNGILNSQDRAGQLAYQNASVDPDTQEKPSSITLMHIAPAATTLGELLVATYEQKLASTLGYTNADNSYADVLQGRGQENTTSIGHSRGTIVQTNALNISADKGYANPKLRVEGDGMAVSVPTYIGTAGRVNASEEGVPNVRATYMANDPVSVIAAGNPGDAMAAFREFYNMVKSNSAHSCYSSGAAGCVTIASPLPNGPQPTNQQAGNVITYQGGQLVQPPGGK